MTRSTCSKALSNLEFIKDLANIISDHAVLALIMILAIVPFSIERIDVLVAWIFFVIMTMSSFIVLSSIIIKVKKILLCSC